MRPLRHPPGIPALSWDDCRLLVESVIDYAIFMLDAEGHVATWNLGAEKIKGYTAEDVVGKHFGMFFTPEDLATDKPARELARAAEVGRAHDEGWRVRKDGSRFWADVVITALKDPDGNLRGFGKVTRDLTARRRSEDELRRAEHRFHGLVDAVADYAIFLLDPDGNVATWNVGAKNAKGYEADEIVGKHFSVFYTPEDRAAGKPEEILDAVRRLGRFEDASWRVRKDGTRFWADLVITAIRDEKGEITGFAKVTRDLTDRKKAEEDLRESEERFRFLVGSLTDYALYMLDHDGRVSSWNLGAERMKGYRAGEIIGTSFSAFFPPEDIRDGKPARELAVARETGRFEDEGWRVRKDGTRFWANVVVNAVRDESGTLLGFAKITRDLTARREAEATERTLLEEKAARGAAERAERQLRESEEQYRVAAHEAETANRIKDEFLATVSHELRTPLNAIVGWSAILRQRPLDPAVAKGIEVIHRNAHAQVKIVEDILDVSRIITGKFRVEPMPTDMVALAREAIDVVGPSASAKEITVDLQPEDPNCVLLIDPERLQQTLWNLLSNAIKFTDAGGTVRVVIRRETSRVIIEVTDTGVGIEPDFLPFAFERFKQADASTTRRYGGLGLGLALVRHIVELHGGSVAAESDGLGKGSTFRVTLPVRAVS